MLASSVHTSQWNIRGALSLLYHPTLLRFASVTQRDTGVRNDSLLVLKLSYCTFWTTYVWSIRVSVTVPSSSTFSSDLQGKLLHEVSRGETDSSTSIWEIEQPIRKVYTRKHLGLTNFLLEINTISICQITYSIIRQHVNFCGYQWSYMSWSTDTSCKPPIRLLFVARNLPVDPFDVFG